MLGKSEYDVPMTAYRAEPLGPTFGAKISGLDLRDPIDEATATDLVTDFHEHRLLVIPGQELTHADHLRVSRIFGTLDLHVLQQYTVPGYPEVITISNIFKDGEPIGLYDGDQEEEWHTDYSWKKTMSSASLLYSVIVPSRGGATLFADTTAAHDELPKGLRERIGNMRTVHSMTHLFAEQEKLNPSKVPLTPEQRAQVPDVEHPLVRVHPATGRRSLLLGDMIISGIVSLNELESATLLDELHAHATRPKYVYGHHWSVGDLVIWDNRATMHTATPCDHRFHQRLLYRTTVM